MRRGGSRSQKRTTQSHGIRSVHLYDMSRGFSRCVDRAILVNVCESLAGYIVANGARRSSRWCADLSRIVLALVSGVRFPVWSFEF